MTYFWLQKWLLQTIYVILLTEATVNHTEHLELDTNESSSSPPSPPSSPQMIYNTNNPGAPPMFYQCADVSVMPMEERPVHMKRPTFYWQ